MKILTLLVSLLTTLMVSAKTIYMVENGKLTNEAVKQGGAWHEKDGYVREGGTGKRLLFSQRLKNDDFSLTAKLSIKKLGNTAAGFYFGPNFFGFDGTKGFFTEGGTFGGTTFHKGPKLTAGKEFTFQATGKGGQISFSVDGQEITQKTLPGEYLSGIALRPHRGELSISELKISGDISELEKLNHLFTCGKEGYKSYRIPALVTTTKGTLLAFSEGRKHHSHDHGDIDIVLKRSTDNGRTWSDLEIVFDNGNVVAGNPAPIVDQKTGRIFLLSCTSNHHEYAIYQGKGRRGIHIQHSDDDGKTWSEPRDISKGIYPANWRWYATGPCSGIQLQEGKHAGRLVCPANHTIVEEEGTNKNIFRAHSIYSDDNGKTWQLGESSAPGGNESSIAEVNEDTLFHSIRMQSHRKGVRGTRYSKDGGVTWTELKHDFNLPCPRCQGAVIRDYSKPNRLIHSNPASKGSRVDMTVRISEDGGKTWPYSKLLLKTSSAYSDLSLTKDGKIAILYEGGHFAHQNEGIVFELVDPASLKKKLNSPATKPANKLGWGLWKERQEKFNAQAKQGDIDLLLIGDSITHYWQTNKMCKTDGQSVWDKHFKDKKVANFGIGSDRTQHLLYRLQNGNLENIQPKHIVLMIGTNNASSRHTPYDIYLGTKAIIDTIQKKSPNSTILLYEIFPRIRGGEEMQMLCHQANELTNSLCDGKKVIRCSINKQLLNTDGNPNKSILFDGIHISPEGYEIWAKDILKHTSK